MNNKVLSKHFLITVFIAVLLTVAAFGQDDDLKSRFESEYEAWKTVVEKSPSSLSHYNSHLYEIVKMGVPVLPLIIEKMKKKEFDRDFLLGGAASIITKKKFPNEEWPEGTLADSHTKADMYVNWWHNGIKNTSKDFNRYYQEWKSAVAENNVEIAEKKLKDTTIPGIAAMAFMIEKIEGGDLELIKMISYLTDGSISENASKDECLKWWNENKEKYIIDRVE